MATVATEVEVRWANGYPARVDVEVAQKSLEELRNQEGRILPEDVVKHAKRKSHPLHNVFDWDDSEAAEQWRLEQARRLIRSIHVIRKEQPINRTRMFSLERVSKDDPTQLAARNVYRSTDEMLADPDLRKQLLHRAMGELLSLQRKYRALQELAVVFSAIDAAAEEMSQRVDA